MVRRVPRGEARVHRAQLSHAVPRSARRAEGTGADQERTGRHLQQHQGAAGLQQDQDEQRRAIAAQEPRILARSAHARAQPARAHERPRSQGSHPGVLPDWAHDRRHPVHRQGSRTRQGFDHLQAAQPVDGRGARAPQGDLQRAGPQAQPQVRDGEALQAPRGGHQDGQAVAAPLPDSTRARRQPRFRRRQKRPRRAALLHAGRHGRRGRGALRARHGRHGHVPRRRRCLWRRYGRYGPGRRRADGRGHVRRHHRRHAATRQDRARAQPPGERPPCAREALPRRAHRRGARDCLPGG